MTNSVPASAVSDRASRCRTGRKLPAYSPHAERDREVWRVLRRRSTHNRLFDTLADLRF
jgi:hypothetical protein